MGRCNNRRVQQAAQASKNTPSRARFSKPPPKKNSGGGRGGRGVGRGESGRSGRVESGRGRGRESGNGGGRGGQSSAAVINKLSKRVHYNRTAPFASSCRIETSSSRRCSPLDGVDISKLDEITLSEASIQVVTKLLTDLNVMESTEPNEGQNLRNEDMNDDEKDPFRDNDDEDDDDAIFDQQQQFVKGCGYSEYEDDFEESDDETPAAPITENEGGEGDDNDERDDDEQVHQTPLFLHLTAQLSFSEEHAKRAYRAIENWQVPTNTADTNQTSDALEDDQLALAMDWLCLHLTDAELKAGFRPSSKTRRLITPSRGIILAGTSRTRAIPHASISVAKPMTNDQEWRDTLRRQSRKVGFLRLGFLHAEAEKACDDTMHVSEKVSTENDEDALRIMLSLLEKETLGESFEFEESRNQTDLAYAKSEREQEIQALEAIFDDQFKVRHRHREGFDRYLVSVSPVEDLRRPGHSEECKLHVFVRPGYPVLSPPLLLFTNPTLPPSLLRRINTSLIQQAYENIGEPSIFAVMDFLSNNLHEMQVDFIKEQHSKETEAEQLRIWKEADYDVDEVTEAQHDNGGKIGRRQKAKLRAAEKSFDRAEREEIQWHQRQEERLERVKSEQNSLRLTMAERALKQRAEQRIAEEAEQAYRKAMNAAFNQGESADEARAAARKAQKESLRHNGENVSSSDDEDDSENMTLKDGTDQPQVMTQDNGGDEEATKDELELVEPKQTPSTSRATPATMAFMERLRQCYNDAASEKSRHSQSKSLAVQGNKGAKKDGAADDTVGEANYHFEEPIQAGGWETAQTKKTHVPMPIPVPALDLKDVMKDVIKTQNEQPWLISPEARVLTVSAKEPELTPEQRYQRNTINKRLRDELTRKHETADTWAKNNTASPKKNGTGQFHTMRLQRQRLPACMMKNEIIETIALHQITLISGDTGCGKTTQVPQLVLDDMILKGFGAEANMVVTQPRRISAIGVSHRIASERCEKIGETAGYSIRMESKRSSKTRLLLCTTGVLLRRLQCDPDLASVSHVFVDEVHERDLNTDFLLIVLKDLLARRKSLKLVLMSATLNATAFSDYFGGCPVVSIPGRTFPVLEQRLEDILQMTGYEVQEHSDFALKTSESRPAKFSKSTLRKRYYSKYNPSVINSLSIIDESKINYELIAELVEHIALNNEQGAVLIFLPGMMEITKAIEELYKKEIFQSSKVIIYPLHSSLSTTEQTAIFEVPPEGVRKIVVTTNIAETSITIEDVVYVVDTGRVKENRRDVINDMSTLVETWVSRASAKQRRGRAGRVREGIAYHLFSSHTFDEMEDYQLPEMLRVGLEDLVLSILLLDLGEPSSFLAKAVNPPSALAMRNSLKLLEGLGAVEVDWKGHDNDRNDETIASQKDVAGTQAPSCGAVLVETELTALGFHLATLPVDPRVGKMMIYGALFQCTDPALTIAASMSARSPFVSPFDKRDEADTARKEFAIGGSDHLTTLNAFNTWKEMRRSKGERETQTFLRESFLSRLTLFQMEDLRKQYSDLLVSVGFLPKEFRLKGGKGRDGRGSDGSVAPQSSADAYSHNIPLIKAILCAGLYPNIIVAPRSLVRKDGMISDKEAGECAFQSLKGEVYLHPCTISFSEKRLDSRYCCYHEIVKTSKTYVRDCTTVSEFALLLFGGSLKVYHTHGVVTVDGWLKFKLSPKAAALVKHLRAQMESMLLKKIVSPEEDITGSNEAKGLIQAVSALFAQEVNTLPELTGAEIVRPWKGGKGGTGNKKQSTDSRKNGGGRSASRGGRGPRSGRGHGRGSNR